MATQYISKVKTHRYNMINKSTRKHRSKGSIYMIRHTRLVSLLCCIKRFYFCYSKFKQNSIVRQFKRILFSGTVYMWWFNLILGFNLIFLCFGVW